jgi:LysR family transcriptional regulator, nitrogen assimilation regulatory protein
MHQVDALPAVDLYQLRVFVSICETSSFTKTAAAFGVSQPTVSRLVSDLEKSWGGELFYRTGRGVTLSKLGQAALLHATDLLKQADRVSEELRRLGKLPSGEVVIGLPPSLIPRVVPQLVNELADHAPGIRLKINQGFSDQIERWRLSGEIEIGILSKYQVLADPGIEPVAGSTQIALIGARTSWEAPAEIPFVELAGYRLVLPGKRNGMRTELENVAGRLRISLNVFVETDAVIAHREMCLHCNCYTINAPGALLDGANSPFASSRIVQPSIHRYFALMTTQHRPLSRAGRQVADRMEAILKGLTNLSG